MSDHQIINKLKIAFDRANSNEADILVSGQFDLPTKEDNLVKVHFDSDSYAEFKSEDIVPNSVIAFSTRDLQAIANDPARNSLGLTGWFHIQIRHASQCTLHYKTVDVDFILDRSTQKPFYIDTENLKCVYLEKSNSKNESIMVDCSITSPDRTNKEVMIYTNRACCCNNNDVTAYGWVSCDDGWRGNDCR